jgi:hypothetical protein
VAPLSVHELGGDVQAVVLATLVPAAAATHALS